MSARILILGGTGFIGPHVVRCLHASGHQVAVFHRGSSTADLPSGIQVFHGDRHDQTALTEAMHKFRPETLIDVVPLSEQDAREVLEAGRRHVSRVVAISSADVYRNYDGLRRIGGSPPDPTPLTEDAPLREHLFPYRSQASGPEERFYHYEKILVERAVLGDPEIAGTVLRLPMVYGPGDRQHRLHPYLKRIHDGRPAILLSEGQATWRWSRGHVENVAAAIALAATDPRAAGHVYNVAEPDALPEAEWVRAIGAACGWPGEVRVLPAAALPPALAMDLDWRYSLEMDTRRLRDHLGYTEPIPPAEALRRTIGWERAHPPAEIPPEAFNYPAEDAALAGD